MIRERFITSALASFEIDLPHVFTRGLHFDLKMLQWSKKIGVHEMRQKTTPSRTFVVLHSRTYEAPHREPQPEKMKDALDGVGCAGRQSQAARHDSGGVFVYSKFRASRAKSSETRDIMIWWVSRAVA